MESAVNLGAGWRDEITPFIEEELGHKVLDPCKLEDEKLKGLHYNRLPDGYSHWHQMKNSKNPVHVARFNRYMRVIIDFDFKVIEEDAGYLILLWDKDAAKGAGTQSEATHAFRNIGLPIFCVNKYFVKKPWFWRLLYCIAKWADLDMYWPRTMPAWLRACCTEVFDTIEELKEYLANEFEESDCVKK